MDALRLDQDRDVVVAGGGAAGLSAALTLARARRSVVVIDGGQPRNAPAQAAHGLLGLEGINPMELLDRGREDASSYGAEIISAQVVDSATTAGGFKITLDDGRVVLARQLLITTGVLDELPYVAGLRERWGRDVVHCPYCHGWEIREKRIGLLATGPMSALQALLFHQWSDSVQFFTQGLEFGDKEIEKLAAVGISVTTEAVSAVEVSDDRLVGVRLEGGQFLAVDALAVPTLTRARIDGFEKLGLKSSTTAMGTTIAADAVGHTSVPGVWAAGNAANPSMQVSEAAANGSRVAMTINTELVFEDADRAVERVRATAGDDRARVR